MDGVRMTLMHSIEGSKVVQLPYITNDIFGYWILKFGLNFGADVTPYLKLLLIKPVIFM